jgi:predicted nucleic acid-binding protein
MNNLFATDSDILVSWITPLEVTSALWRKAGPDRDLWRVAERRLMVLEAQWKIVGDVDLTLISARLLVELHGLRSGDAVQLASAHYARSEYGDFPFVTSDEELIAAARADRFNVLS